MCAVVHDRRQMNRLYVTEGTPTITGAIFEFIPKQRFGSEARPGGDVHFELETMRRLR